MRKLEIHSRGLRVYAGSEVSNVISDRPDIYEQASLFFQLYQISCLLKAADLVAPSCFRSTAGALI